MSSGVTTVPNRSLENVLSGGAGGWLRNGFPKRVIFKMLLIIFTLVRAEPLPGFLFHSPWRGSAGGGAGSQACPWSRPKEQSSGRGLSQSSSETSLHTWESGKVPT